MKLALSMRAVSRVPSTLTYSSCRGRTRELLAYKHVVSERGAGIRPEFVIFSLAATEARPLRDIINGTNIYANGRRVGL